MRRCKLTSGSIRARRRRIRGLRRSLGILPATRSGRFFSFPIDAPNRKGFSSRRVDQFFSGHPNSMNDLRVLRDRFAALSSALDRSTTDCDGGNAAMCVVTATVTTYPTSAGSFYACHPELLTGPETEGATPTFTPDTATTIFALNVGSAIPPSGTKLVIHSVGGRWSFRFDG